MATQFIGQATQQLAPAYQQQTQALQAQVPAIQQLYQSLFQGLEGQRQTGTQNILEGASGRGLLRSTVPVNAQTTLEQGLLQQRGQYAGQQAKDIAGVQESLGKLNVEQANAISTLANALYGQDIQRQQFAQQQAASQQQLSLQQQVADRTYQLQLQQARRRY